MGAMLLLLPLLLLGDAARAQAGGCTPGLTGDLCCSLNGKLTAGKCVCDPPWSGPRCGTVDVWPLAPAAQPGGTYGYSPNVSSWGGNALLGDDGLHHMFVAEIPGGLRTWGSQSQCVHATSPNISGPYARHDLVLGHECHNPSTLRHPKTGEWLMFHIVRSQHCGSPSGRQA